MRVINEMTPDLMNELLSARSLVGNAAAALQDRVGGDSGHLFRVYDGHEKIAQPEAPHLTDLQSLVAKTYCDKHTQQTVAYVKQRTEEVVALKKKKMTLWQAAELLNEVLDESDPDLQLPQIEHCIQTGEALREAFPEPEFDWLHLVGFIHDLGKVIAHPSMHSEPQWSTVGDTYPVGCAPDKSVVYSQFFQRSVDQKDERYNTKLGMYTENCGFDNVTFCFGHDEYMYQVCTQNGCKIPYEGLYIIRYHSFYSFHTTGGYRHLANDKDMEMLKWLKAFQKFDLYSKSEKLLDMASIKEYYLGLVDKYFPDPEGKVAGRHRLLHW